MRIVVAILLLVGLGTAVRAAPTVRVTLPAIVMDDAERTCHVDAIHKAMRDVDAKSIDVGVTKLEVAIGSDRVIVTAEVKLVIAKRGDRIHSLASTKATVTVARREFHTHHARALRQQALRGALVSLQRRLQTHVIAST